MVTAGRVAMGEVFEYDLYASRTKIYVEGKLRVYDNSRMEPSAISMDKLGYMEGYLTNGTIYVYSENLDDGMVRKLNGIHHDGNVRFAAGKIDDDFMIIRFLGNSMIDLKEMIDTVWGQLRRELLGKEPVRIRKY
jgi:urease accessory protein